MAFLPQEIIRVKRDGGELTAADIAAFIRGVTEDAVSEGQIAAFAMTIFLNGMSRDEAVALTLAMRDSGDVLSWSGIDRPVVDKHSTGGVGDNVSLMLAPIVAACGAAVPMISGRGLGHTGGTLDKMESIPGYRVTPSNDTFRRTVAEAGCAIIGQTGDLAPADRRIYAIRDVTATVESIPLITASILSKKLAAGLDALVLDVKTGNGAFMQAPEDARALAESLVAVANGAGLETTALLTDMNEPLASAAGNAVEVDNAAAFLTGRHRDPRLEEVTLALAGQMLMSARLADTAEAARAAARSGLESGKAAECFARMVSSLGGPVDFMERPDRYLPSASVVRDIAAQRDGYVGAIDTRGIGLGVVALGGGRTRPQDAVDHSVGFSRLAGIGTKCTRGDTLGVIHANDDASAREAEKRLLSSYEFCDEPPQARPVILSRITAATV
jgi:thymidine phosphorylase